MRRLATGDLPMNGPDTRIVVIDLRIPFFRLVFFFVKAAVAMIPATIILIALGMAIAAAIAMIFGTRHFDFMIGRWIA
jgi:hypothetical protein